VTLDPHEAEPPGTGAVGVDGPRGTRPLFPRRLGSIWGVDVRCHLEGTGPFDPYRTRPQRL
jgi:hypothetical protein